MPCTKSVDLPVLPRFEGGTHGGGPFRPLAEQYDMFSMQAVTGQPITDGKPSSLKPETLGVAMNEEDMVRHLLETGRYRILRKFQPRPEFPLKGIILDTETTDFDARKDEIIEIGVVAFTFDAAGRIGDVTATYGGLRQPGFRIPPDITKLTGIPMTSSPVCRST